VIRREEAFAWVGKPNSHVRPLPAELLRTFGPEVYREAYGKGRSLTAHLNSLYPEAEFKDGLDGYSRLLKEAGILTRSNEDEGYFADRWERFNESDHLRALVPEFVAWQWRKVKYNGTRAFYGHGDDIAGSLARPFVDAKKPRADKGRG
jgi:hypothetical protein